MHSVVANEDMPCLRYCSECKQLSICLNRDVKSVGLENGTDFRGLNLLAKRVIFWIYVSLSIAASIVL